MQTTLDVLKNSNFFGSATEILSEDEANALVEELSEMWDKSTPAERRKLFREGQEMILGGSLSPSLAGLSANKDGTLRSPGLFLIGAGLICMGLALL